MYKEQKVCATCRNAKLIRKAKKAQLVCAFKRRGKAVKHSYSCQDWEMSFRK